MFRNIFTTPNSGTARRTQRASVTSATALVALSALLMSGCASNTESSSSNDETGQHQTAENHGDFLLTDSWAKSAEQGEMTSVFGVLDNGTDTDIEVTGVSSAASEEVELHETYLEDGTTKMREIEGGIVIPAHDTVELEPGGNHIMLMNLTEPLLAGDQLTLKLQLGDGTVLEVTAEIRDFAGANEEYGDDEHAGHGEDHQHDDHAEHEE